MDTNLHRSRIWVPLAVAAAGLTAAILLYVTRHATMAVGLLIVLQAVALALLLRRESIAGPPSRYAGVLETPFLLAHDAKTFERYRRIARALLGISVHSDRVYRDVAMQQLDQVAAQLEEMSSGTIVFHGTETWRIVYEQLLREPGIHLYRSVSLIRNPQYWQDGAGQQSMQLNLELHSAAKVSIERICILADELWPADSDLPHETVRQWIHQQTVCGIWIKVVRESTLRDEPGLVRDIGIYGSRALGVQQLDESGTRTRIFTITFGYDVVREAEDHWKRLSVYAISYRDLMDQFHL